MIKKWSEFNENRVYGSKIQAKIDLLKDLSLDLSDMGLEVNIWSGTWKDDRGNKLFSESRCIIMSIKDNDSVLDDNNYFENDLFHKKEILDFEEVLKSYQMRYKAKKGNGQDGVIFYFSKQGSMTRSPLLN